VLCAYFGFPQRDLCDRGVSAVKELKNILTTETLRTQSFAQRELLPLLAVIHSKVNRRFDLLSLAEGRSLNGRVVGSLLILFALGHHHQHPFGRIDEFKKAFRQSTAATGV
jgi:hypothetical protein